MKKLITIILALLGAVTPISAQEIPSYFLKDGYLQERLKSLPKGKHFMYITDYHTERSSHTSTAVMSYVKKNLGIDRVVFGGDCFDWAPDSETAAQKLGGYFDELYAAFGNGLIWVQGNHDCNSSAVTKYKIPEETALIPDTLVLSLTVGRLTDDRHFDEPLLERYRNLPGLSAVDRAEALAWIRLHYWVDDPALKIRFITIDTYDGGHTCRHTIRARQVIAEQMPFLERALESTPRGYTAVVLSHQFGHSRHGIVQTDLAAPLIRTVARYRAAGRKVFLIGGHQHVDDAFLMRCSDDRFEMQEYAKGGKIGNDALLVVWCNRDAWKAGSKRYAAGGPGIKLEQSTNPPMKRGTPTEVSFDIVTLTRKGIVFTRIGGGSDRTFNW